MLHEGVVVFIGRPLLESGAYSDLSFDSAALFRGQRLFDTQQLLVEIK